jgi:hypothetical protein
VTTKSSFHGSEVCPGGDFWVVTPCSSEKARESSSGRSLFTDFLPGLLFHPENVGVVVLRHAKLSELHGVTRPRRSS